MLAGVLLRHYKCYKGINFVPFFDKEPKHLKLFIGNNGTGKSSILEALDAFFNAGKWITHIGEKKKEAFIAPLFLIQKEKIFEHISPEAGKYLEKISDFFWSVNLSDNPNYKYLQSFFPYRDNLNKFKDSHYLFFLGEEFQDKDIFFATFDHEVKKIFDNSDIPQKILSELRQLIAKLYSYLYIPVEASVSDFLKLEARGMQELMDKNIKETIDNILKEKYVVFDNEGGNKNNVLHFINKELKQYVDEVEKTIQKIEPGYDFKMPFGVKQNLTSNDVREHIIQAYYANRKLKKDGKTISELSSGERRKSLIDIAYAFLSQNEKDKSIILAIDEPESSLHISKCYDQFEQIEEIANVYKHQTFIATHWYGCLPLIQSGSIHHFEINTEGQSEIKTFDCGNYFEERRKHPNDVYFKSFVDLATSIVSSMRNNQKNWIIVEGTEDKNYIEYYIKDFVNCKILPVGGASVVGLLYNYLYLPLSQSSENKNISGKILCLTDTDQQSLSLKFESQTPNKKMALKRLQFYNGKINLFPVESALKSPTEIEDALIPEQFYNALKECIKQYGNEEIKTIFSFFHFDTDTKFSFIRGDDSIIIHNGEGRNAKQDKKNILDFIEKHKRIISIIYTSYPREKRPDWISDMITFFNGSTPKDFVVSEELTKTVKDITIN